MGNAGFIPSTVPHDALGQLGGSCEALPMAARRWPLLLVLEFDPKA